jgi:hypothetical protein
VFCKRYTPLASDTVISLFMAAFIVLTRSRAPISEQGRTDVQASPLPLGAAKIVWAFAFIGSAIHAAVATIAVEIFIALSSSSVVFLYARLEFAGFR